MANNAKRTEERRCQVKLGTNYTWDITKDQIATWGMTAGVQPQQLEIVMPQSQFILDVDFKDVNKGLAEIVINDFIYKNLLVVNQRWVSKSQIAITLADERWLWQFKICSKNKEAYIYNKTRYDSVGIVFSSFSSENSAKHRYLAETLNNKKPWTAYQILKELFKSELKIDLNEDGYEDNNFYEDDLDYTGSSLVKVFSDLLTKSAAVLYYDNGYFKVGSEADDNYSSDSSKTATVSGRIFMQGLAIRPQSIELIFPKLQEFQFTNDLTNPWVLVNVIPMPFSSSEIGTINGEAFLVGDFLPFDDVLSHFGVKKDDFLKRFPQNNSMHLAMGILESSKISAFKGIGKTEKIRRKTIAMDMFFQHFRNTWRIPQELFDKILHLDPHRVAILDTYTKARKPSTLEEDWSAKMAFVKGGKRFIRNFNKSTSPSPVVLKVDKERGVVYFSWGRDPFSTYPSKWHGQVKNEIDATAYMTWKTLKLEKFGATPELVSRYRFELILSGYDITDYLYVKTADLKYNDGQAAKLEGTPVIFQKLITREPARFDIDGTLKNKESLDTILRFEKELAEFMWKYKAQGIKTVAYSKDLVRLHGALKSIAHNISGQGDTTTIIASPTHTLVPDYSILPPGLRTLYLNTLGG